MTIKIAPWLLCFSCFFFNISGNAADWYRWRGPDLNGISQETGWQAKWPDDGPKRLWKASVGTGFSSITVNRGHAYTMGNDRDIDTIYCFDAATGLPIWTRTYPCELDPKYFEGGPTATPTADGDRVYTLSRKGDLLCVEAAQGQVVWSKNVTKDFGCEIPTWGFSSSALVEGDMVILDAGSAGLALDKKTGNVIWSSGKGVSGYSTPVPFDNGGQRALAILGSQALVAVSPADGKLLWSFPWKTQYDVNAADPIISGGKAFVTSGYDHGCALLNIAGGKPAVIWQNKSLRDRFNNAVLWKGYLYSADEGGQLKCVAWDTGDIKWADKSFGQGSLLIADGKIIGLSEKGELMVADASPEGFKPISRVQVLGGKCWTTPVLSNGRIYCRNAKGDVVCVDVSGH